MEASGEPSISTVKFLRLLHTIAREKPNLRLIGKPKNLLCVKFAQILISLYSVMIYYAIRIIASLNFFAEAAFTLTIMVSPTQPIWP